MSIMEMSLSSRFRESWKYSASYHGSIDGSTASFRFRKFNVHYKGNKGYHSTLANNALASIRIILNSSWQNANYIWCACSKILTRSIIFSSATEIRLVWIVFIWRFFDSLVSTYFEESYFWKLTLSTLRQLLKIISFSNINSIEWNVLRSGFLDYWTRFSANQRSKSDIFKFHDELWKNEYIRKKSRS